MVEIIEEKVSTILRPTGINLAPYVINPYQGCELGCVFCYAQFSKTAVKSGKKWGSYVKVKINAAQVLEEELEIKKPEKVLLGSTTECFQPAERKYRITENILRVLNRHRIKYVILSRSPLIASYLSLLKEGFCEAVYFTVDILPDRMKRKLEPKVPAYPRSLEAMNKLAESGINTIAYFCPVMPWFFDAAFEKIKKASGVEKAEFEIMNFKMANTGMIIKSIKKLYPQLFFRYERLLRDRDFYEQEISALKEDIAKTAKQYFVSVKIHSHHYAGYFGNLYGG
ncbi:MAG: radical SAM protein [Candidatus Omnitrophica bacterium]|nr:radical SAM protein [Candidatus Omnitrophota bacterium]MBU1924571.1 radical SAM protein [Candidatus Omnitrophota bacterium]